MKDWEKHEYQIFRKLRNEFPESEIKKNERIKGIFSHRSRQIDIFIKGELAGYKIFGIVDCKNFTKKIDVKTVEAFIGLAEDVKANIGILITNIGFTKGAENRIKGYHRDIRLNVLEYENLDDYHFEWDKCDYCDDEESFSKGVIVWHSEEELKKGKVIRSIEKGDCSKCGNEYLKCLDCGEIHLIDLSDIQCGCGNMYAIKHEYIGQGMTESRIILKSVEK